MFVAGSWDLEIWLGTAELYCEQLQAMMNKLAVKQLILYFRIWITFYTEKIESEEAATNPFKQFIWSHPQDSYRKTGDIEVMAACWSNNKFKNSSWPALQISTKTVEKSLKIICRRMSNLIGCQVYETVVDGSTWSKTSKRWICC